MTEYAGFWRRFLAAVLDVLLVSSVLDFLLSGLEIPYLYPYLLLAYWIFTEVSPLQGSFGKWLMGIRVCAENGGRLSLGKAAFRNVAKIAMMVAFGLGYLYMLINPKRQALHDALCKAVLPRIPSQEQPRVAKYRFFVVLALLILLTEMVEYRRPKALVDTTKNRPYQSIPDHPPAASGEDTRGAGEAPAR